MRKRIFLTLLFLTLGLAVTAVVSYVTVKEARRNKQIEKEIELLRQEAEQIRKNNEDLREKIFYFETPEFQERVAKEKLNFQKPDEKVVIVKPSPSLESRAESANNEQVSNPEEEVPNHIKWWNQFFKY
ncbi:MAG: septum formation initiator family protein [Candidatus Moranbacteria bacterium]|nr:septum formation initiator family protein [Candidatus Moranbacteria bacterium]